MSILIGLLSRYWLHLLVVGLVAYAFKYTYDSGVDSERDRWEKKAYQAVIVAHEAASKFTAGVLTDHKETEQDAQTKIDNLDRVVDNSISLREQLDSLQKRHSADRARSSDYGKTAQNTIRVLARLLNQSEHMAGVYAENADRNRIAGLACEKSYADLKSRLDATRAYR